LKSVNRNIQARVIRLLFSVGVVVFIDDANVFDNDGMGVSRERVKTEHQNDHANDKKTKEA